MQTIGIGNSHNSSCYHVMVNDKVIVFRILKSKRRKKSEIVVDFDEVIVRVPFRKSFREIESFVMKKANWILIQLQRNKLCPPEIIKPSYKNSSTLPFLGINYPLYICRDETIDLLSYDQTHFTIYYNKYSPKQIYNKWLIDRAKILFFSKVSRYSDIIGVSFKSINIKNIKSRWGSATNKGAISLNLNLIKTPQKVIDYVIIHELCHLKIMNHSKSFWSLVKCYCPSYKEHIEWLRTNGNNIIA